MADALSKYLRPVAKVAVKGDDFERKPAGVFKVLDYLNRGQYAVLNPLRRLSDPFRDYTAKEYLGSVWKGLKGEERSQTTDVLGNLGWNPTTKKGKFLRGVVGLAGDILLDPTTYIPVAQLSKMGKLAKAGKLIKYGDRVFNLTNKAHIGELEKLLSFGAKNADEAGKAAKLLKGVFRKGAADDIVKALGEGAEVVKLAPTWGKQFKAGQRSLLQFQLPRMFGGASTRIAVPGEQGIMNAATKFNRRLQAGRMLADKSIWSALPDASLEIRRAANKGNLLKVGSDFFDLSKAASASRARNALRAQAAMRITDEATLAKTLGAIDDLFKGAGETGRATDSLKAIQELGLDALAQGASGLRAKAAAKRFGNSWLRINAGRTANKIADTLNLIPEGIKKIRRHAEGLSGSASNIAAKDIKDALGKDGFETLIKGLKKGDEVTVTLGGKPVTVSGDKLIGLRLEGLEGLGSRRVLNEIAKRETRLGRKLTLEEAIDTLDVLDVSKGAQAGADVAGVKGVAGLDPETVQRMKNTLRSWGNVNGVGRDGLDRLTDAFRRLEQNMLDMGALNKTDSDVRELTEVLGYIPRRLKTDPADIATRGGRATVDRVREASRGMTFFEAQNGVRSKTSAQYFLDNFDKPVAFTPDGKAITGADVLGEDYVRAHNAAKQAGRSLEHSEYQLGRAAEKLDNAKDALEAKKAARADYFANLERDVEGRIARQDSYLERANQRIAEREAALRTREAAAEGRAYRQLANMELNPSSGNINAMGRRLDSLERARNATVPERLHQLAEAAAERTHQVADRGAARVHREYVRYENSLNRLAEQVARWDERLATARGSLVTAQKNYEDALKTANDILQRAKALDFSTEAAENVAAVINGATRNLQMKTLVSGLIDAGTRLDVSKPVPYGMVRASDILSDNAIKAAMQGGEAAGEYADMIKFISSPRVREALENTVVPYQFVQPIKNMLEVSKAPAGAIMRLYDHFQGMLKPLMLSRPSTQVRNTISSFFMSWAAGDFANPAKGMYNLSQATKFVLGGKNGKMMVNGVEYSMRDLWKLFTEYGGHESGQIVKELAEPLGQMESKILRGMKKGVDKITAPATKWWAQTTEDSFRFAHFINELQKGATAEDAIESVAKHFYDYGDLSKVEKEVARRIIPFYTFTRKNLEANLRYLAMNRGYLKVPSVMASNINQVTADDKEAVNMSLLDNERNKWLVDQGAFRLPWGKGQRLATLEGFLPQTDVQQVLPWELAEKAVQSVSPILKTPYAVIKNYDAFKKRPIYTAARPREFLFGAEVDPRFTYAITPAGNLHMLNKMAMAVAPERAKSIGAYLPDEVANEPNVWKRLRTQAKNELGFRSYLLENEDVRLAYLLDIKRQLKDIERQRKRIKHPAPGVKKVWAKEEARLTRIMKSLEK